jgi:hypothetical protein
MTLEDRLISAVAHFWATRSNQDASQGSQSGSRDAGNRAAVTGGKQLDGFVNLLADLIEDEGMPRQCLHASKTTLPGYFRPEKDWDFLVVAGGQLIATVEFKSQVGPSFGNNFNNRVEEAVGNATDLNTAFREGAFRTSARPWIGYLMLRESTERSLSAVRTKESHFPVSMTSVARRMLNAMSSFAHGWCVKDSTTPLVCCFPLDQTVVQRRSPSPIRSSRSSIS